MSSVNFIDRIRFERQGTVKDADYGTVETTWVPIPDGEVWAEVQDVLQSRAERDGDGIRLGSDSTRVRIYWRADLDSKMRIVELQGMRRTLSIISGPIEIMNRSYLEFVAERFTA